MENLLLFISLVLLLTLISYPIILFYITRHLKRFRFITYMAVGVVVLFIYAATNAWWSQWSDQLLMAHLGYDFEALTQVESYQNVAPENMQKVKQLEIGHDGVGWPVGAILGGVVLIPYLLIVYGLGNALLGIKKYSTKKSRRKRA